MQRCPFCGAPETDRFALEGRRFLVFACQFSPEVDPGATEEETARHLAADFPRSGQSAYFRGVCDRLHRYVVDGEGAKALGTKPGGPSP